MLFTLLTVGGGSADFDQDTNEEVKGAEAEDDAVAKKVVKCVEEEEVAKKEITTRRLGRVKQVTHLSQGTEDIYFVRR